MTTLEAALELILAMGEIVLRIGSEDGAQLRLHGGWVVIVFALVVLHVAREEVEVEEEEEEGRRRRRWSWSRIDYRLGLSVRLASD